MIKDIIEILLPTIENLNFAGKVGGIVSKLTVNRQGEEGTVVKTIPVYYNDSKTTCNADDYIDMMPDSDLKSVIYFEDEGTTVVDCDGQRYHLESNVKLVCWCNLKLINSGYEDASLIALNLIDSIPLRLSNSNPYSMIRIDFAGHERTPDIFADYTYDEAEKQFLVYPYDYFALNFNIKFAIGKGCVNPVTLNPSPCY